MTDRELDEMLNTWAAPEVPPSLRTRVRTGFAARAERRTISMPNFARGFRPGLFGAALAGAGAVLLVVTQAFPQMLRMGPAPVRAPYTVASEFIAYDEKGLPTEDILTTSYNRNGREVVLSRSFAGDPWRTVLWQMLGAVDALHKKLILPFVVTPEQLERVNKLPRHTMPLLMTGYASFLLPKAAGNPSAGCVEGAAEGRESILRYATAVIRVPTPDGQKMTAWMAPELGCFALKVTVEERRADGSFRLTGRKLALGVKVNP
jgi:hypothetical protein